MADVKNLQITFMGSNYYFELDPERKRPRQELMFFQLIENGVIILDMRALEIELLPDRIEFRR